MPKFEEIVWIDGFGLDNFKQLLFLHKSEEIFSLEIKGLAPKREVIYGEGKEVLSKKEADIRTLQEMLRVWMEENYKEEGDEA